MKSIIKLLKKRGSGGFTLVEMIVAVALIAVLLGGMMIFVSPIIRSFNDNKKDLTAENTSTCVQEYITRSIRNANQIAIFTNTNYTEISSNATYTDQIKKMNSFCASVNGTDVNKKYLLKCMSLKYDATNATYYLYNESVNMASDGTIDPAAATKVFSDCLYNGLHLAFDFNKPKNGDYPVVTGAPEYRDDALEVIIRAFRDSGYNNMLFYGTGITELRQIKVMLASGGSSNDYYMKIYPTTPLSFEATTDGSRDIYIYYVVRQITTT